MRIGVDGLRDALIGRVITEVRVDERWRDSITFTLDCGHSETFTLDDEGASLAAVTGLRYIIGAEVRDVFPYALTDGDAGHVDRELGMVPGMSMRSAAFAVSVDAEAPLSGRIAALFAIRCGEPTVADNTVTLYSSPRAATRAILNPAQNYEW